MELIEPIAVNVVLGIVLLALLIWKQRPDDARLTDTDEATDIFSKHYPDTMGTVTLAADRRSALIDLKSQDAVGLLQRHGHRWNARVLVRGEIASIQPEPDGSIKVNFVDFAWPRARIRIDDADLRATWLARLDSLSANHRAQHPSDWHHA